MRHALISVVALAVVAAGGDVAENPADITGTFEGVIEPFRLVQLASPSDGVLETVSVERGDLVHAGDVIATLESSLEKAALAVAHARTELVGSLRKREAQLAYLTRKLSHDRELYETGIIPEESYEQNKTDKTLAEAEYLEAQENLRLAFLNEKRAAAALELRTIRSPIDGVVVTRYLSPGEMVTRQYQSKIVEIAQVQPLRVEVTLPATLFGKVAEGMKANVTPDLFPEFSTVAQVSAVDRTIDAASGTFRTRLELANTVNALTAGLKCRVRFDNPPSQPTTNPEPVTAEE